MQTKTMMPLLLSERTRLLCSLILLIVTMMVAFFHPPLIILTGFFSVQILVKIFAEDENTNMSFMECLIVGPLKLLVSGLMIGVGLPGLDSGGGLALIGVSLLFLGSGMQNLYWIFRSGRLKFHDAPDGTAPKTTRQQMKAIKDEDALVADLFSSFGDNDLADKDN